MPRLYLFGSRATGDHSPDSDWDVILFKEEGDEPRDMEAAVDFLKPYTVEHGGNLDLFLFGGDCLISAMDEHRRIMLSRHTFTAVKEDLVEIDINTLLYRMTRTKLTDFGTVRDGNGNYIG